MFRSSFHLHSPVRYPYAIGLGLNVFNGTGTQQALRHAPLQSSKRSLKSPLILYWKMNRVSAYTCQKYSSYDHLATL